MGKENELTFQNDMIRQLITNGWLLGKPENYNRELALYEEDLLGFVKETPDAQWQKFCKLYPNNPEQKFLERVASQLNKADPNAPNKEMRTFAAPWGCCAMNCAIAAPASASASSSPSMS